MKIKELKSKNKELAKLIKEDKFKFKQSQRSHEWHDYYAWRKSLGYSYRNMSSDFRHQHIAYCLLRGRKYEQIESYTKEGNSPSWDLIEQIMREYREINEIECSEVVNV